MEAQTRIQLLGELRVEQEVVAEAALRVTSRFRTRQTASLLAFLAYHLERAHSREVVIELLWPEVEVQSGRERLNVALSSLRGQLEAPGVADGSVLVTDRLTVRLNPATVTTDVLAFEASLGRAARATDAGEAVAALAEALELYQGPLLPGFYEDWVLPEQLRLADCFFEACLRLAGLREQEGLVKEALEVARRAVAADPRREEAHRAVMRLCALAGEPAAALRQLNQLGRILAGEGLAPTAATVELGQRIQSGRVEEWKSGRRVAQPSGGVQERKTSTAQAPSDPPLFHSSTLPLAPPGGALPLDSPLYLERPTDAEFRAALLRGDSIVLLKGPRQVGKTSLLARGLQAAREAGRRVVLTDLETLTAAQLAAEDALFLLLAEAMTEQLGLETDPEAGWNQKRGWNVNFERFLRREVLGRVAGPQSENETSAADHGELASWRVGNPASANSPTRQLTNSPNLVWALDGVDRLFNCDFGSELFALFRAWHNQRALDPEGPWSRLTLAIAYATEPHLFIPNLDHSPFNVGTRLLLEDFTPEQVAELNRRCGSPLRDAAGLARFTALVGGHPYLAQRGLHELATRGADLERLEREPEREEGPFASHLRRLLLSLARDPELGEALRQALAGGACPDARSFYRLRSAGVLLGDSFRTTRPRCDLYRRYLLAHL